VITAPPAHPLGDGDGDGGDRPIAVFVHGLEDDWRSWRGVAAALGEGWDPIALDMPWRAGNDYGWKWEGPPVAWVAAGLQQLDRVPDLLVGHSFGANAALEAVSRGQGRARLLVMAAPFYRPPLPRPDWKTWNRSRALFELQMREGVRVRLRQRLSKLDDDVVESMTAKVFDRIGLPGFLTVFEQYLAVGQLPLAALDIPVLILAGGQDPSVSRDQLSRLADDLPNATLGWRCDFDHFSHIRRAEEVAAVLAEFAMAAPVASAPNEGTSAESRSRG
jgi:pimeloyl-ACP methyl ester carboxylesterase